MLRLIITTIVSNKGIAARKNMLIAGKNAKDLIARIEI